MMCDDARLLLHAYLDDELDAAGSAAVTRHLRECAACTARHDTYATLRKAMAQPTLYHRAPDALRRRWSASATASASLETQLVRRRAPMPLAAAAGFVAALLLSAPAWLGVLRSHRAEDPVVAEALSGHLRSLQEQHLMDVVSTDQHTVKPWFEGRLDFAPRVKDLAGEGFPLVGGRLDAVGGRSVAALIYKRRLHVINLFQWPVDEASTAQAITQEHGYTVIGWTGDHMRYVAVSDVNEAELRQFALAFQNEPGMPAAR
ncbi:MAG TPA: anti-sigma factor [Dyella sp.]|uniref:anti-sigma factor family protein n=1 Tax=Dyella sp. TaxID=1869338 RepID=UPI002D784161|nr:anti-sigma factor [Dyella sp.]HET6554002.1 anti-sigma factor [Dyella sp.]